MPTGAAIAPTLACAQGYVQLYGSHEFFWAEGFPNAKFHAANIGDLQVRA
jgi:hypothetical protein